jgi:hypothetical protein
MDGWVDGAVDCITDGLLDGVAEGWVDGEADGVADGCFAGFLDGWVVGTTEGFDDGLKDGRSVRSIGSDLIYTTDPTKWTLFFLVSCTTASDLLGKSRLDLRTFNKTRINIIPITTVIDINDEGSSTVSNTDSSSSSSNNSTSSEIVVCLMSPCRRHP